MSGSASANDGPITRVGRYEIRGQIGSGGCGQVFRAFDPLLKREVALKRVWSTGSGDQRRRSLLREARALSALQHHAIAGVHDVLETEHDLWLVQELIGGHSLRDRIRDGLDLESFWVIAEDCVSALEYAASAGIVHCDFKPENVMVTPSGRAKVLDFGMAQRIERAESPDVTQTDTFIPRSGSESATGGTPSYMAPEVIVGGAASPRSDLFSVGVVFYEALTGVNPFRRADASATLTSVLEEPARDPRAIQPTLPDGLADLLLQLLRKEVHERPESATAVRRRLEALRAGDGDSTLLIPGPGTRFARAGLIWGAVAIVAVAAIALLVDWPPIRREPAERYLLVEPFEDLSSDGVLIPLAGGFTEAIRAALSKLGDLYVVEPSGDPGTGLALYGSLDQVGEVLRVTYRVVDRRKRQTVTGDVLGGTTDCIFELQNGVALGVRSILIARYALELAEPDPHPGTSAPAAYEAYLNGRGQLASRKDVSEIDGAIRFFEKALERDPDFVAARAGLGEALWARGQETSDPGTVRRAEAATAEAVRCGPDQAEARIALGTVYLGTGRAEAAESEFERAIELAPTSLDGYRALANARAIRGDDEGAEAAHRAAIDARPEDWLAPTALGVFQSSRGQFGEAADAFERATELAPSSPRAWRNLGAALQRDARPEEAISAYRTSISIRPTYGALNDLGVLLMARGELEPAAEAYREALNHNEQDYRVWSNLAAVLYLIAGREAQAREVCRTAIRLAERELEVSPSDAGVLAKLSQLESRCGDPAEARRYVERALSAGREDANVLVAVAGTLAGVGESDRACEILEKALDQGLPLDVVRRDPALVDVRGLACFEEMTTR